jgi:hypothetical protein
VRDARDASTLVLIHSVNTVDIIPNVLADASHLILVRRQNCDALRRHLANAHQILHKTLQIHCLLHKPYTCVSQYVLVPTLPTGRHTNTLVSLALLNSRCAFSYCF